MPDNISISISADTAKLEAQLGRAQAAARELQKEFKRLNDEGQKTGDWSKADALAPKLAAVKAEVRSLTSATKGLGTSAAEASIDFATLGKQIGQFAKVSGVAIGGIKALRFGLIGLVGSQIIRGLTAITDKITEIQDLSKKTGLDPATIQQFGDAIAETGGKADDAAAMMAKLVEPFAAEKKLEMASWWGDAKAGAESGLPPATAYAKALNELHVNMQQFGTDAKGQRELLIAVAQSLQNLAAAGKLNDANRLSVELFGKNWREAGAALQRFVEISKEPIKPNELTSEHAAAAVREYNIQISELTKTWNELLATLATSGVFQVITGLMAEANKTIATTAKEIKALIDLLSEAARLLGIIPRTDFGGGGDTLPGAAAGGYVSGPGTGTSDSILARLSDGEYVMRAAAVRRWGPRFMAALNAMRNPFSGFADGGAVRVRGVPGFAGGGLARAGGGATVNLMFPGGSFALTADNAIVGGLTREAKRAGMLAGGRRAGLLQ